MLPGFPKPITTEKIRRGRYRIKRNDGYQIVVAHSPSGYWYQVGNLVRFKSLSVAKFDMERGYMAHDYVESKRRISK